MSGIATAVIGSAMIGGVVASNAAGKAASATNRATDASIAEQNAALTQQATLSQPYRDLGTGNIQTYQDLLTGGGKGAAGIQSTLESLPGYQFTKQQGTEAAMRAAGASGLNLTGNQLAGVEQYGAGLADQTYTQRLNELLNPIQLGQAAAAGQAANIGTAAGNISSSLTNQGNNIANIDVNEAASISKLAGNATNQLLTYNTLKGLNTNPTPVATPTYGDMSTGAVDPGVNAPVNTPIYT